MVLSASTLSSTVLSSVLVMTYRVLAIRSVFDMKNVLVLEPNFDLDLMFFPTVILNMKIYDLRLIYNYKAGHGQLFDDQS